MDSLDDVLKRKEFQAERLRSEIEALRLAARIMEGVDDGPVAAAAPAAKEPAKSWP